ncbi:MAG: hypothetical protein HYY84_11590 [Deltaproteobacteria bacterium]|nr:hypothetical protein [Deltaproteobacteria bacterium]
MTKRTELIDEMSRELEELKTARYECPGPSRDVDDSVKDAIEKNLVDGVNMFYTQCIAIHCCACDRFDTQDDAVAAVEDKLDALMEAEEGGSTTRNADA